MRRPYQQPLQPTVYWHPTDQEIEVMAKILRLLASLPNQRSRIDVAAMAMKYGLFENPEENERVRELREILGMQEAPAGPRFQFWRHRDHGEVWAVRLDPSQEGAVTGACGPLAEPQAGELPRLACSAEAGEWIQARHAEFNLHDPPS